MNNVYIKSLGYYIPRGRLKNEEILAKVQAANENLLSPEDLELILYGDNRKFEFLGIKTRSACREEDHDNIVTMAVKAAQNALLKASLTAAQIDLLIVSGVTNPFREPSLAIVLAKQLELQSGDFFDINDTCNGFMKSIDVASQYIKSGKYRNILLVTSENPYEIAAGLGIDYRLKSIEEVDNKFSTLLVGSGAAAMVLSASGERKEIVNYAEKRETVNWDASVLTIPNINLPESKMGTQSCGIWTDARLVSAQVIKDVPDFIKNTAAQWGMTIADINVIVMHQLGNNVTFATLDGLQINHDKAPVNTFSEFGNMASANIPVNLALAAEAGFIKEGDSVLLISSACGLSYSLIHLKW
ncbi:MAG TPA: 3-oxoacyl-[acyl-carrier-protein] synthase III C-terminal domain-containing protein [Bacillota bacterium]|nr:3-oxoacyl-[acyl-carrier-protein] synthase III C-terminal domain-containing protein [Bacillota bacterium]